MKTVSTYPRSATGATLSTSYHAIEDQENYEKYRKLFECSGRLENWELDTYKDNLKEIDEALEKIKC